MVTYGPWVQPEDFTRSVTGYGAFAASSSESEIKNVYAFAHSNMDGEYRETALPARVDSILGTVTQADPTYDGSQYSWPNLGSAVVKVAFSAPTGTVNPVNGQRMPPFIEDEWAEVNHVPQVFSAYDVNGWLLPAAPPGAIGAEIEGQPAGTYAVRANVTQATLTATALHNNVDATADVQTEASVDWRTEWMAGRGTFNGSRLAYYNGLYDRIGPGILTLQGNMRHGSTENVEVDVTEHVSAMGELVLTKKVWANSIDLADLSGEDAAGFGTTLLSPTITYTFHPPRYRWIYDTPGRRRGTTPPLRLTQRGDGLTGGAPRLLGRNSQQSTNRLSGGYF